MIRHVPLIRCQQRQPFCPGSRVEMYDDHLLAWMGHLHAERMGGRPGPLVPGARHLTQTQVARVRTLRPSTRIEDLAVMFGVSRDAINRACKGLGIQQVRWGRPVESDRGEWFPSCQRAADELSGYRNNISDVLRGRTRTAYGRRWTYSKFPTCEAWAAAKQRKAVTA